MNNSNDKMNNSNDKMNNSNDKMNNDVYRIIINIKNFKALDKEDINNIRDMSNEDKMKIILTYNEMLTWVSDIITHEK
jgi:hypothetical protein